MLYAPTVLTTATSADGVECGSSLADEAQALSEVVSYAITQATLKSLTKAVAGELGTSVSSGGMSLYGQRNTKFDGDLALPGGAGFNLPAEVINQLKLRAAYSPILPYQQLSRYLPKYFYTHLKTSTHAHTHKHTNTRACD